MIRDVRINNQSMSGNIDNELQRYKEGRKFAIEQAKLTGKDYKDLIAYYDKEIARMERLKTI